VDNKEKKIAWEFQILGYLIPDGTSAFSLVLWLTPT